MCAIAFWCVEVRDAANHCICTGQPPITKNYLAQEVNSTEVEEPWSRDIPCLAWPTCRFSVAVEELGQHPENCSHVPAPAPLLPERSQWRQRQRWMITWIENFPRRNPGLSGAFSKWLTTDLLPLVLKSTDINHIDWYETGLNLRKKGIIFYGQLLGSILAQNFCQLGDIWIKLLRNKTWHSTINHCVKPGEVLFVWYSWNLSPHFDAPIIY